MPTSKKPRNVELLFLCDPKKNTECRKTMCHMGGGECHCTTRPEFSVNGKILWPAFFVKGINTDTRVGCERCPLGIKACDTFRRRTPSGECPCDVYDTYTDYLKVEDKPIEH